MNRHANARPSSKHATDYGRRIWIGLGLVLLALLLSSQLHTANPGVRAQVDLLALAAQQPDAAISVIVQKTVKDNSVEAAVARLGGTVTTDLSIINAFAAALPAHAAVELAEVEGVRWVSLDAATHEAGGPDGTVNIASLKNTYDKAIGADKLWAQGYQGSGIGVAVVDSGINWQTDLYTTMGANRVVANVRYNTDYNQTTFDNFGHGSHIAGIVGGNGRTSSGNYIGVAPLSNIINVKVSNDDGSASTSSVVAGLQWILANKAQYNIRVVNLSLNSGVMESYLRSPLDAAVEILWFNGIVVVVSAGNNGTATLYPPANDPFVITVGATDNKGTNGISDDSMAGFSAYGTTSDGVVKPDLVAPGTNIVSLLGNASGVIPTQHPGNKVDNSYFRMSGTSMAAPMVSGAVALLLQDEPRLTPDQVKYRLKTTANKSWGGYSAAKAGAGYLDVYAAVTGTLTQSANTGLTASQLLWSGATPVSWGSVNWNSVNWGSVNWNSVNWGSVNWNSVNWNSDYWGQ